MKNITVYKCTFVHVRKKHKYLVRARKLRGKERQEALKYVQRARRIWVKGEKENQLIFEDIESLWFAESFIKSLIRMEGTILESIEKTQGKTNIG